MEETVALVVVAGWLVGGAWVPRGGLLVLRPLSA